MLGEIFRLVMMLDVIAMFGLLAEDMMSMGCDEKADRVLFVLTVLSVTFLLVGAYCLDYGIIG